MEKAVATTILEILSKLDPTTLTILMVVALLSPVCRVIFVSWSMIRFEGCIKSTGHAYEKEAAWKAR